MVKLAKPSAVVGTALISLLGLVGCGSSNGQAQSSSGAKEKTLVITANVVGGKNAQEDALFAKEIGSALHCKVNFFHIPTQYDQKRQAMLESGQKLDVIYITEPGLAVMASQNALLNLKSRIQKSPVLGSAQVVPNWEWNYIKLPGGPAGIYGVPMKYQGALMPIVRADWMKELHLSNPTTLHQFYKVFLAFKKYKHAYGLTLSGLYDIQPFMSAAGVKDRYVSQNGKLTIPYATSAAVPVYEWLHMLYQKGLLDPNFATNSTADERNMFLSNRVGMFVYWDAWVPMLNNLAKNQNSATTFDAEAIAGPKGPNGQPMLRIGDPSLWAIPKNAPHPNLAFRFLEWWNTQPGEILGSLGVKGIDYTVQNGQYTLTSVGKLENMDHGDPHPMSSLWKNPIHGMMPGYANARELGIKYGFLPYTTANWTTAQKIVWHYGELAIMGRMTASQAVQKMHQELLAQHLIDQ